MNKTEDNHESRKDGKRRKLGRVLFMAGLVVLSFSIVSVLVVSVAAYSGLPIQVSSYSSYLVPIGIFGVLMVVAGIVMVILPEGPSKDGVWVMMMGPYAGRN
ncbi:hypothetical protein EU546_08430 [Candidatus Thorarchaeota archaeon]|jgi:nitrate reductase gamma subunit|nr:MAG: hypothetical protein EU546_08430 [Candidatus Thorarchaeota archaeon]